MDNNGNPLQSYSHYSQQYPAPQFPPPTPGTPGYSYVVDPKFKKPRRRIFRWVFLAIQTIFVIWLITGIAGTSHKPTNCQSLDAQTCQTAYNAGRGLGVALIILLWVFADIILGITFLVLHFSRRNSDR